MPMKCCIERWDRLMEETPDMPVFTLLGQDKLAIETVQFWMKRARESGVSEEKLAKVQLHLEALEAWKTRKLPD